MGKVQLFKFNTHAPSNVTVSEDKISFTIPKPIVIQSSEIVKVKIGFGLKVPDGHIITLYTGSQLIDKVCELFPSVITFDSSTLGNQLEIAIRNNSRNQVNLMPGISIAEGYLTKIQKIDVTESGQEAVPEPVKSKPQKKDPFNFEVK